MRSGRVVITVLFSRSTVQTVLASLIVLSGVVPLRAEALRIRLPAQFEDVSDPSLVAARHRGGESEASAPVQNFGMPHIGNAPAVVKVLPQVQITDHGKVIYDGPYDVNPTLRRIREGMSLGRHDGTVFRNREGILPPKEEGFYLEFRIKEDGLPFPGAQRVLLGKDGSVYFTGDHYLTFHEAEAEAPPAKP